MKARMKNAEIETKENSYALLNSIFAALVLIGWFAVIFIFAFQK